LVNGRQPQQFGKCKTTPTVWKMKDNLNILRNARDPQYFVILKITSNFGKGRTISILWKREDYLNMLVNGR
jgi:hypothetical protein